MPDQFTDPQFLRYIKGSVRRESYERILDTIYCDMHNTANDLLGNTAEHDFDWFCRTFYERTHTGKWEQAESSVRDDYEWLARAALHALEQLQSRVGHRCEALAGVVHELLKSEWRRKKRAAT